MQIVFGTEGPGGVPGCPLVVEGGHGGLPPRLAKPCPYQWSLAKARAKPDISFRWTNGGGKGWDKHDSHRLLLLLLHFFFSQVDPTASSSYRPQGDMSNGKLNIIPRRERRLSWTLEGTVSMRLFSTHDQ
jgi:hypothetical protein